MQTRSQTLKQMHQISYQYVVNIDFDAASEAWKSNKISKGNGTYTYKCQAMKRDGCPCSQGVSGWSDYCRRHLSIHKNK
jgi:hypothetical protein